MLFDLMRAHVEEVPPSPRSLRADLPPAFEQVILTALAKDPAQRYQTASAMSQALQLAGRDVPAAQWRPLSLRVTLPDAHAPTLAQETLRDPPRRSWVVIGIAIAVVVLGIGIVAATRGGHDDHVETGPNVERGPNVGPSVPRLPTTAAYDPKHFDASAYLATATRLATDKLADAKLVRFDIAGVFPDGRADLTLPSNGDSSYLFRSPSRSVRSPGTPSNVPVEIRCYVEVTVTPAGPEVAVRSYGPIDADCKAPLRPDPKCTLAQVWKLARLAGEHRADVVAKIAYLRDDWFFDTGAVKTFADSCR